MLILDCVDNKICFKRNEKSLLLKRHLKQRLFLAMAASDHSWISCKLINNRFYFTHQSDISYNKV